MSGKNRYYIEASKQAALSYASFGFPVFPCNNKKEPATMDGFKSATTDKQTIIDWWSGDTNHNIGVATGAVSGMWVVDVDIKDDVNGYESLLEYFGDDFMESMMSGTIMTQVTASGGLHLCFEYEDGISPTRGGAGYLEGIDIRTDGGYIIVAPSSVYVSKYAEYRNYEWKGADFELFTAPEWANKLSKMPSTGQGSVVKIKNASGQVVDTKTVSLDVQDILTNGVSKGVRDTSMFGLAKLMKYNGVDFDTACITICMIADKCSPPFEHEEAIKKIERVYADTTSVVNKPKTTNNETFSDELSELDDILQNIQQ